MLMTYGALSERFGVEYYGGGLSAAVSVVLEKLLRPTRHPYISTMRQEQYEKQETPLRCL